MTQEKQSMAVLVNHVLGFEEKIRVAKAAPAPMIANTTVALPGFGVSLIHSLPLHSH